MQQDRLQQLLNQYRRLLPQAEKLTRFINQSVRMNSYKTTLKYLDFPHHVNRTLARADQVYQYAFEAVQNIACDPEDLEDLCALLCFSREFNKNELMPAGLYLSVLVNTSPAGRIKLALPISQPTFHFLGFGLPTGKTLTFQGNLGDFTGARLNGGCLRVASSSRNWCGLAMEQGEILIEQDCGQKTGEMMAGGRINVNGSILGLARSQSAGGIYLKGRAVTSL
jgi:hypothetical protein